MWNVDGTDKLKSGTVVRRYRCHMMADEHLPPSYCKDKIKEASEHPRKRKRLIPTSYSCGVNISVTSKLDDEVVLWHVISTVPGWDPPHTHTLEESDLVKVNSALRELCGKHRSYGYPASLIMRTLRGDGVAGRSVDLSVAGGDGITPDSSPMLERGGE